MPSMRGEQRWPIAPVPLDLCRMGALMAALRLGSWSRSTSIARTPTFTSLAILLCAQARATTSLTLVLGVLATSFLQVFSGVVSFLVRRQHARSGRVFILVQSAAMLPTV